MLLQTHKRQHIIHHHEPPLSTHSLVDDTNYKAHYGPSFSTALRPFFPLHVIVVIITFVIGHSLTLSNNQRLLLTVIPRQTGSKLSCCRPDESSWC